MGAAANFGRSGTQSPTPHTSSNDLLNDDFNPRDESSATQSNSSADFGDFEKAFGGATEAQRDDDDFADFSSAFSNQSQPSVNLNLTPQPPLLGAAQTNLIGGLQANLFAAVPPQQQSGMFAAPNLISPPQGNNNVNNDLLGGFSSLSIQPQSGFGATSGNLSGPTSLLDGFDSGW